ncbi:hypothetical protein FVE85_5233 [Porphyridium purpureum]|uniref:Fe2OG dioxygenase domain-containing protein n=1 Tax=Porphyridium purpureum TaxID=35688 RepID=A0A5J4Z328_PORPP|nr:hypothetical protein FVE85_5233 [Porphyridium purpureum]|eukprot:POR4012..scf295_1
MDGFRQELFRSLKGRICLTHWKSPVQVWPRIWCLSFLTILARIFWFSGWMFLFLRGVTGGGSERCCARKVEKQRGRMTRGLISLPLDLLLRRNQPQIRAQVLNVVNDAFGADGMGVIEIMGVAETLRTYRAARMQLLRAARQCARLDEEQQTELSRPEYGYMYGWSRGKEEFDASKSGSGQRDSLKVSYYMDFPANHFRNVWPDESLVPNLKASFTRVALTLYSLGMELAFCCDQLMKAKNVGAPSLHDALADSTTHKGRLLYYCSPVRDSTHTSGPSPQWCGLHSDHGAITGLVPSLTCDEEVDQHDEPEILKQGTGLTVLGPDGNMSEVRLDPSSVAFQVGEVAQVISGGSFRATPHSVPLELSPHEGVQRARSSFALFLQPSRDFSLGSPETGLFTPSGVPPLEKRFVPGDTFGQFEARTLAAYRVAETEQAQEVKL